MKYIPIVLCFSIILVSCSSGIENSEEQNVLKIEDVFEFNELLNQSYNSPESEREDWTKTMDSLNLPVMEEYIQESKRFSLTSTTFGSETYEELSQNLIDIKSQDDYINSLPERVIFAFYNLYFVHKNGLLFDPCISSVNTSNGISAVYMSEGQLEALRGDLGKMQILEVELIECVEQTEFTIYRLVGI